MDLSQAIVAMATIAIDQRRTLAALVASQAAQAEQLATMATNAATAAVQGQADRITAAADAAAAVAAQMPQLAASLQAAVDQNAATLALITTLTDQRATDAEVSAAQVATIMARLDKLEAGGMSNPQLDIPPPVVSEIEAAAAAALPVPEGTILV